MNFLTRLRIIILAAVALVGVGIYTWLEDAATVTGVPLRCSDIVELLQSTRGQSLAEAFYKHIAPPLCRPQILPFVRCWEMRGDPDTLCRNGLLYAPGIGGEDPNTDLPARCIPNPLLDNPIPCHTDYDQAWVEAVRRPAGTSGDRFEHNKYILRVLREIINRE